MSVDVTVFRYGEQYKFGMYLEEAYGKDTAEDLQNKSRQITKYSDIRIKRNDRILQ